MVAFVVLHYISYDMTKECVDNLISKFGNTDSKIILVDNGSTNGSGKQLKEDYANSTIVDFLSIEKNCGFGRGNNVGYTYAKNNLNPDFIIFVSNDVLILDENYIDKVYEIYKRTKFHVLGPDIYSTSAKIHQSPFRLTPLTREEIEKYIKTNEKIFKHFRLYYLKLKIKGFIKKILHVSKNRLTNSNYETEQTNVILHGASMVFSRDYIDVEDYAYNPKTYLYMEEDILYFHCMKNNYKIVYSPLISVNHLEDVDTNIIYKTGYVRLKNKMEECTKSARILLEEMTEKE